MSRRKGLNFHRKRRVIQTSTIRSIFFWVGECVLAFVIGCVLVLAGVVVLTTYKEKQPEPQGEAQQ